MALKDYIVLQSITLTRRDSNIAQVDVAILARRVRAENEAEALGKFMIGTDKECTECQKLAPEVVPLDNLNTIE